MRWLKHIGPSLGCLLFLTFHCGLLGFIWLFEPVSAAIRSLLKAVFFLLLACLVLLMLHLYKKTGCCTTGKLPRFAVVILSAAVCICSLFFTLQSEETFQFHVFIADKAVLNGEYTLICRSETDETAYLICSSSVYHTISVNTQYGFTKYRTHRLTGARYLVEIYPNVIE